jgi:pimeloyl-ACP methyl ester carboxylesterase
MLDRAIGATKWAAVGVLVLAVPIALAVYQAIATQRDLAAAPAPGQLMDVGGHRLHLLCKGMGLPIVVFEASGFGNYLQYERVQADVAGTTRACAYDRAGMGYSEPGPMPRTLERLSADLEALVLRASLPPPYVLVGASAGGIVARHFASRHMADVCGLVLIDSPHEDFASAMPHSRAKASRQAHAAGWLARFGLMRLFDPFHLGDSPRARGIAYRRQAFDAAASLVDGLERSLQQLRQLPPMPPDLPLVVLTHTRPGELLGVDADEERDIEPKWQELQRALARKSSRGRLVVANGSGHLIVRDRPELVTRAVLEVVAACRR